MHLLLQKPITLIYFVAFQKYYGYIHKAQNNYVNHWNSIHSTTSGSPSSGLKMQIVFKRRLTNELLTTYLPSLILILMCYATSFFKPIYFEAAVTVNLSILLVTTTLFIRFYAGILIAHLATIWHNFSVMAKLPATSYVRMVDIWLIFVQLYPFIEAKNINIIFL